MVLKHRANLNLGNRGHQISYSFSKETEKILFNLAFFWWHFFLFFPYSIKRIYFTVLLWLQPIQYQTIKCSISSFFTRLFQISAEKIKPVWGGFGWMFWPVLPAVTEWQLNSCFTIILYSVFILDVFPM